MVGWKDGQTDRRTDIRTDFPCILQDIIPLGSAALPTSKLPTYNDGQGKGTADHLLPLGDLFFFVIAKIFVMKLLGVS